MIEIQKATISAAGAFICIRGLYLFALGAELYQGRIPVYRLGGHREGDETGWACAVREVLEETGLQISLLVPAATYLLPDGDHLEAELERIQWQPGTEGEPVPMLVVAYRRAGENILSLMYLAQTDGLPAPSSEVRGLILLKEAELHRLCQEPVTLGQFLGAGGEAYLNQDFDPSLILEPFTQPRLLSRILLANNQPLKG